LKQIGISQARTASINALVVVVRSSEASVKFETTRRYTLKAVIVNNGFTHILLLIQLLYRSSSIIFSLQTTLQTLFGT
jgi:hypothetical protein